MVMKKVMKQAHYCVGTLSCVTYLINEVIDLAWYCFATHSKYCTLSGSQKIDGAWLQGICGIVYLLGHVKRIMCNTLHGAWVAVGKRGRGRKHIILLKNFTDSSLGCLTHCTVIGPFHCCQLEMFVSFPYDLYRSKVELYYGCTSTCTCTCVQNKSSYCYIVYCFATHSKYCTVGTLCTHSASTRNTHVDVLRMSMSGVVSLLLTRMCERIQLTKGGRSALVNSLHWLLKWTQSLIGYYMVSHLSANSHILL